MQETTQIRGPELEVEFLSCARGRCRWPIQIENNANEKASVFMEAHGV